MTFKVFDRVDPLGCSGRVYVGSQPHHRGHSSFSMKMTVQDLTSPVAAHQLVAGIFLLKMAIQDLTSPVAAYQPAAGRGPPWGVSKPVCAMEVGVDRKRLDGILVTHSGQGPKAR